MKGKKTYITNENRLLIILAFMSLSVGIWSRYRQLWLKEAGYLVSEVSKILSVALICSSILSFIISLFSPKIRVKHVVALSFILRSFSLIGLLLFKNDFIIKSCTLLCVMCEVIFSISFYPLLSFESKNKDTYKRKMLVEYLFKDVGVIGCGLLFGVSLGKFVFDYDWCLIITIISGLLAFLFLINLDSHQHKNVKSNTLKKSLKQIFENKINRVFFYSELFGYIAYGIIFDLVMIILTSYLNFNVTLASVFIIVSNMLGTIFSFAFSKFSKDYSVSLSAFIKYGTRILVYIIAFIINKNIMFIFAIIYAFITSRILEDKVTGTFVDMIDEDNQFLFSNLRYFNLSLGEGIGAYLAGILLSNSLKYLFVGASIFTLGITLTKMYLSRLKRIKENS